MSVVRSALRAAATAAAATVAAAVGGAGTALARTGGGSHSAASVDSTGGHAGSHAVGVGNGSFGDIMALIVIALIIYFIYRRFARGPIMPGVGPGMTGGVPPGIPGVTSSMPGVASSRPGIAPGMPSAGAGGPGAQAALSAIGAVLGAAAARVGNDAASWGAAPWGAAPDPVLSAAVDKIRKLDPGFELETFLQRAEMTFFLVKRGMQQNDAAALRPYLNDAVFDQVARSIGQAKAEHRHALLESLNVRALHVQSADCDDRVQRLQIHFDLVYRAKLLDDANRVLSDEGDDQRHGERWTFVRDAAARTPVSGGVTAARCPACGAELRLNLDGTCTHCRASVTNGSVDWVVADVQSAPFIGYTGDSSLAVAAPTVAQGIANLQASDPGFSFDAFRARAQAAFLALQDAWCRQNLDAGRAFLSPGAYFTWRAQLETLAAEGRRNVMESLEVRAIAPVQVVHGRVFDDLTVRITAAAADFEVDAGGKVVFGDRTVRPFTEDWTFQRSVGVATSQKPGTLENTCPNCGAPVSLNQIGECRYCKAAVTSGKFDWVVSRIEQEDMAAGNGDGSLEDVGADIALRVGGAIVGGLLGSLLSGDSSSKGSDDGWN